MTRFSIILPCFNAEETLSETLASLSAQHFTDWEAICVDDGSTDATRQIIDAATRRDPRIRRVSNPGKGPSQARNFGALTCATGEIIAFCDADDIWTPEKLSRLDREFAEPRTDAIFGRVGFFDTDPGRADVFSNVPNGALTVETLLGENPVCTMSNITLRREAFVASSGFDETMVHNEDLDWLIRLVGGGARVIGLEDVQVYYRASQTGLSANLSAMQQGRTKALASARRFGVIARPESHAVHARYLARRALRLGHSRTEALKFVVLGLAQSPSGFLSPARRGVPTALGAACALVLPRSVSTRIFS